MANALAHPTLYFGYGSNLWLQQMSTRCPDSTYSGLARLSSYRWMINTRGYANIVEASTPIDPSNPSSSSSSSSSDIDYSNTVYGLVYLLPPVSESQLDKYEGVPRAYTKEYLSVDFWPSHNTSHKLDPHSTPPQQANMLVYINRNETTDAAPNDEYVGRMNSGIEDAVRLGVPGGYVKQVLRRSIPEGRREGERKGGRGGQVVMVQAGKV